jgi:transcriptional regulator
MYDIPYFKAANSEDILAYMKAHPFGLICGSDENGKPVATQVPFLFEQRNEKLFLQGHFMKKQDHTNAFYQNPNVLAVFTGAHTYVSASWYNEKRTASTWNYQSVQVAGTIKFQEPEFLLRLLVKLTETFEKPESPALVQLMDPEYVKKMMQAIVAFEVEVLSVRHVFKLSQNRDRQTQKNIVEHLQQQGGDAGKIAQAMESNNKTSS